MKLPIYLDYNATTPVDPRVVEAMMPFFTDTFGNSASIDHQHGAYASEAVEKARATIAATINARPEEIIFTSGATESDNLALIGVMEANEDRGDHLVTCRTEHPAVLETATYLQKRGKRVVYLDVDSTGLVDPDAIKRAITNRTVLVSIMSANNEIGTLAPLAEIGSIAHERAALFHTDATQAIGKIEIDVQKLGIDLMSFSSHKIYGPKGVGALYVRRRNPFVRLSPLLHGGGHERGVRSGTVNVAGVVGFAAAMDLAKRQLRSEQRRLSALGERLLNGILDGVEGAQLNGHVSQRLAHCVNVHIAGVENKALIVALRERLSFSAGSACATSKAEASHVLLALGYDAARSYGSIRLSIGHPTTELDVKYAVDEIVATVASIRSKFTRV